MNQDLLSLLITQTWQVTLLIAIVWMATRLFGKDRPHLAHTLWLLVLIKCLTPPVFSSPTSAFSWMNSNTTIAEQNVNSIDFPDRRVPITDSVRVKRGPDAGFDLGNTIVVRAVPEDQIAGMIGSSDGLFGAAPAKSSMATNAKRFDWSETILFLWIIGASLGLIMTTIRFAWFIRWTRRCRTLASPELAGIVRRLSRELGIKRRVRVNVLDQPVGPAVTGLLRPTILLPASMVEGRSTKELEPLIAHELIHIRRGDLFWALLQTLAQNLFWFHPLVRLATRMLTWESERSCDEETVASLGCSPAAYAKGLLEVLEHKHRLRVAPALPGVRPVDITSARLERVMNLGNGIHRRTPVWAWLVLMICCAAALPGATLVFGQERLPVTPTATNSTESVNQQTTLPLVANPSPTQASVANQVEAEEAWQIQRYPVSDLIVKWKASKRYDNSGLEMFLGCYVPGSNGRDLIPDDQSARASADTGVLEFGNGKPTMRIVDGTLYAFGPTRRHQKLAASIERLMEFGFRAVVVETKVVNVPEDQLESLGIEWSVAPVAAEGVFRDVSADSIGSIERRIGARNNPMINEFAANLTGTSTWSGDVNSVRDGDLVKSANAKGIAATSFVQMNSPVLYGMIDAGHFQRVLTVIRRTPNMNLLQAPTVAMLNGQNASVYSGSQRPFVVGLDRLTDEATGAVALQPVLQVINEGQQLKFNAKIIDNEAVNLDCRMEHSTILKVDTVKLPIKGSGGGPAAIQVPQVATTRVQSSLDVPAGKTLVLSSVQQSDKGENEMSLVFLTCRLPDSDNPEARMPEANRLPAVNLLPTAGPSRDGQTDRILLHEDSEGNKIYAPVLPQETPEKTVKSKHYRYVGPNGMIHLSDRPIDRTIPFLRQFKLVSGPGIDNPEAKLPSTATPTIATPTATTPVQQPKPTKVVYSHQYDKDGKVKLVPMEISEEETNPPVQHFTIRSEEPGEGDLDYQPLVESMKSFDLATTVEGNVEFEINYSMPTIRGKKLCISTGDQFRLSGDHGEMKVFSKNHAVFLFEGAVQFDCGNSIFCADKFTYDPLIGYQMNGSVTIQIDEGEDEKWECSADRIQIDLRNEIMTLRGNATYLRKGDERADIRAEFIEVNLSTDEIKSAASAPETEEVDLFSFYLGILR